LKRDSPNPDPVEPLWVTLRKAGYREASERVRLQLQAERMAEELRRRKR